MHGTHHVLFRQGVVSHFLDRERLRNDADGAAAELFRSDDGGRHWRSLGDPAHHPSAANFHGLCVDPADAGGVLVGTDTGEVWSVNAAGEWQLLGSDMPVVLSLLAS